MNWAKGIALVLGGWVLAACSSSGPLQTVTKGDELASYNFAEPRTFEEGAYDGALLRVVDGVYRIDLNDGTNTVWWGQWGETYENVIVEADITQTSERRETTYGVMCRVRGTVGQPATIDPELVALMAEATAEATAETTPEVTPEATAQAAAESTLEAAAESTSEATAEADAEAVETIEPTPRPTALEGDGYLFLIQGSGRAAILRARGRDVQPIADWRTSDAVRLPPQTNRIRAVCHNTYLALYVNDQLVAEATDDAFRRGQIGLAAAAANRLGVVVEFDNVQVWQSVGNG